MKYKKGLFEILNIFDKSTQKFNEILETAGKKVFKVSNTYDYGKLFFNIISNFDNYTRPIYYGVSFQFKFKKKKLRSL